jgi:hypothetical protein
MSTLKTQYLLNGVSSTIFPKMSKDIPTEIWTSIFMYLHVSDLKNVSTVNRFFYSVQDTSAIWKPQCLRLWQGKRIGRELFYRSNFSQIIPQLSMKEIKRLLICRKQYIKDLIEKKEFVELLIHSTPTEMPAFRCNKWKISYVSSILDSHRTTITKDELCEKEWVFRFKQWGTEHPGVSAVFHSDYMYSSSLFDQQLRWRFYAGNIQVEQYPSLHCRRTVDWGWRMENQMVFYLQPTVEH